MSGPYCLNKNSRVSLFSTDILGMKLMQMMPPNWNPLPVAPGTMDAVTDIISTLKAVSNANQTWVNSTLRSIGFNFAFNNDGQTLYVLADYPGRVENDNFKDKLLVKPVGSHFVDTETNRHSYTLNTPERIHPPAVDETDLTAHLRALIDYCAKFKVAHGLEHVDDASTIPMFFVLDDEHEIVSCLTNNIHPKKVAELVSLGYSVPEIIENKDVPADWLAKIKKTA